MTYSDIAATITGEQMLTKNTGAIAHPTHDEIARLAYTFYEARGRHNGYDLEDWLSAERELVHHYR